jgi:hypothetical protein
VAAFSLLSAAHGRATRTLPAASAGASAKLFGSLVDAALTRHIRNDLARHIRNDLALSDVALYSAGAAVVPSLTSNTYALAPRGLVGRSLGLLTCHGCAVGRPPVTALHHELHVGQCWPFAGGAGQLGIRLALPARIVAVSIDHVPRELAWDMWTAPPAMELWGLIEGADNVARAYLAVRAARRTAGEDVPPEPVQPLTLPHTALYMHVVAFADDACTTCACTAIGCARRRARCQLMTATHLLDLRRDRDAGAAKRASEGLASIGRFLVSSRNQ